jgi:cytochrome P450
MPFSLGQHRCIGEHFALIEIQMVMMRLYHRYHIKVHAEEPMQFLPLVTLKPIEPIHLQITPRKK